MEVSIHHFESFDTLVEEIHELFDAWETGETFPFITDLGTLYMLKLAVHEWIANMVQHAVFTTQPHITLKITRENDHIRCSIQDNSDGFDLDAYYDSLPTSLKVFPERGTGLLILRSCTEDLSYTPLEDGTYCLSFLVSPNQDPWLSIQF